MTTTVQYDLDTSGGLMDEIQALIAPPQTDEPARKYRRIDRETRRTGRTTNRDCCDSCHEGGDLICCDRCPASFHLQCCDPPLEEEDLPTGDWVCHKCTVAPQHIEKTDAEIVAAMNIPKSITMKDDIRGIEDKRQSGDYFKPRKTPVRLNDRLRRDGKQCMRLAQLQAYKEAQKEIKTGKKEDQERPEKTDPDEDDMEEILQSKGNPLLMLIKAASIQNPKQFQLPAEVMTHAPLPGMTRKRRKEDVNKNFKHIHELENGMVPLPAKMCFLCNKSCRVDPLIQCDYCPLLFHRDCLSPPLTTFPTGRWMCPNHPENGLPEFAKASYTEKCKIYHDINNRINQHAVKLDFLNKIHATGPPWKDKPERRKPSQVPFSVKEHYRHPPSLLPTSQRGTWANTSSISDRLCTPVEKEEWLKSVISLQSSIAVHLTKKDLSKSVPVTQKIVSAPQLLKSEKPSDKPVTNYSSNKLSHGLPPSIGEVNHIHNSKHENHVGLDPVRTHETGELNDRIRDGLKKELTNGPEVLSNGPSGPDKNEIMDLHEGSTNRKTKRADQLKDFISRSNSVDKCLDERPVANHVILATTQSLKTSGVSTTQTSGHLSPSSVKTVSTSSLQNLRVTTIMVPGRSSSTTAKTASVHGSSGPDKLVSSSNSAPISDKLTSISLRTSPALLSLNNTLQSCVEGSVDAELSHLDEKLIQVLAWQRLQQLLPSKTPPAATTKDSPNSDIDQPSPVPTKDTPTPILGVFCPIPSKDCSKSVKMRRKYFSIGNSSDADMCLSHYGHCNFISAKHASIFYDEASRHFELLNYSEFGTTVDRVTYTGAVIERSVNKVSSSFVKSVRKFSKRTKSSESTDRTSVVRLVERPCRCPTDVQSDNAGWEGTAMLHHGSHVQFGCLEFVFSVAEAAVLPKSVT